MSYIETQDGKNRRFGENAILLGDENKKITTFMKTYTKYKNRKVKIKVSPSQIIVNNLLNI